nr:immunoglobulin light chain junction region [Macaca mulatta]
CQGYDSSANLFF